MLAEHFPEIQKKRIKVHFVVKKDYYMAVNWIFFRYNLYIDKLALDFSETAFKGCAAHELAHIVEMSSHNFFARIMHIFFSKEDTAEERTADYFIVSDKGLGKELLQFHVEHNKVYKSYKSAEGLTSYEIKRIMKGKSIKINKESR
ncbi:MAG TPA: hypothetical protein VN040_14215 [Pseudosphingobacterium sp.]|nr:hypothetical protein [Pseudosphingobacterium sp.]